MVSVLYLFHSTTTMYFPALLFACEGFLGVTLIDSPAQMQVSF